MKRPVLPRSASLVRLTAWAVLPHPEDVRHGCSPLPLFTTTRAEGSAFFDAQNAKIALARATGRRLHIDLIETYEGSA